MIYGYIRVSTPGQAPGTSLNDQRAKIMERYPSAKIVSETASGAAERPTFMTLLSILTAGDTLAITKLDRFCRSAKEGLDYIDRLQAKGVAIHILNMGLIEDTPVGRLITTQLLAFAEFERAMILERTAAGKAQAKNNPNFRDGRPHKYNLQQLNHAMELLSIGKSYNQVANMTGISRSTLQRESRKRRRREE